jgi:GT2 family glycosyltransferase
MTSYNPGAYLRPAVESLLAQTFADFELVLVEDGSTDGSKDIARAYAAVDPRVRLIDLPKNIGRTPALNKALDASRGEYVAVLDADDVAAPARLAEQIAVLDSRPGVAAVASHIDFINERGEVIGAFRPPTGAVELRNALAYENPLPHSASMFRRDLAKRVGGYPRRYEYAQDLALWIALARHGELAMIPEPLVCIREHGTRLTRAPALALRNFRETVELYRSAACSAGVTAQARRRGRLAIALLHYSLARSMWAEGRSATALEHFTISVSMAPWHACRWLMTRAIRVLNRAPSRAVPDPAAGGRPSDRALQ